LRSSSWDAEAYGAKTAAMKATKTSRRTGPPARRL
jgi:hypothetical protein